jgi:hypothetical protein
MYLIQVLTLQDKGSFKNKHVKFFLIISIYMNFIPKEPEKPVNEKPSNNDVIKKFQIILIQSACLFYSPGIREVCL